MGSGASFFSHSHHLVIWYRSLAVPVDDFQFLRTCKVQIKYCLVAMTSPPVTELPVPCAGQCVEELRVVKGNECVQVLVPKMTLEAVVFRSLKQFASRQVTLCGGGKCVSV